MLGTRRQAFVAVFVGSVILNFLLLGAYMSRDDTVKSIRVQVKQRKTSEGGKETDHEGNEEFESTDSERIEQGEDRNHSLDQLQDVDSHNDVELVLNNLRHEILQKLEEEVDELHKELGKDVFTPDEKNGAFSDSSAHQVLIVSVKRSGSTFMGDFVNNIPGA